MNESILGAVSWGERRIDVFGRGTDNALWHKWYDGSGWHGWENLEGVLSSGAAASSWGNNRLDIFVRGNDDALWHKWYDGKWYNWESLGGALSSAPAAVSWGNNRIDVFVVGSDNALWHKWYDGRWYDWESLGGALTSAPAVASWSNNRLDVFARGRDNALWHKWYDGRWYDWENLGGVLTSAPAAVSWDNNRIDVFTAGSDNALWHKWYDGRWYDWESLGGILDSAPAVSSWKNNRLDIFVQGTDNALWHRWWDGKWYNWESLGAVCMSDSVVTKPDFMPGKDGYSFVNTGSSFGYGSNYKIPLNRYIDVFGEARGAQIYNSSGNWGGSCFGFSTSSVLFNQKYLNPEKYQQGAKITFDLPKPKTPAHVVTQLLERYQISWYKSYVTVWDNPNALIEALKEYRSTGMDPLVLFFYNENGGHAVVAYDVKEEADRYVVHLYDNWDVSKTSYMYVPKSGKIDEIKLTNQSGWKIRKIGFIKASKVKEGYLDKVGIFISVNGNAKITNSSGVPLANIDGAVELMPAPGSELVQKLYQVPEDKYVFSPLCENSEQLAVTVSSEDSSISLEIPCESIEVGVSLGNIPSVELSGTEGFEDEISVDFLSSSPNFTEESSVVTAGEEGVCLVEFIPQVEGVPMPMPNAANVMPAKRRHSRTQYGSTELKVSFKPKKRK